MYKKIIRKIKKNKKIDGSGILFQALFLIIHYLNILLFNRIIHFICYAKGVGLGKDIIFNGVPIIRRYPNSSIFFGNGCKFNSAKNSIQFGINQSCTFVTMNENAKIIFGNNSGASGLKIESRSKVSIGNNVLIGANCIILDNDAHHSNLTKRDQNIIPSRPIIIKDNVFIGLQCTILKGVTIGENSVIGACSVVFNDIPANSIAVGNPCKVIIRKKIQ